MKLEHVALVIVDISGYTQFLRQKDMSLLHAEEIISQLLESVIDVAEYPLILNKLEGDAAFLYVLMGDDHAKAAKNILQQVLAFFPAFHQKAVELSHDTSFCDCDACSHISRLKLKAFLHHGEVVVKKIRQFEELAGENVILIHRLLKNGVSAAEYILMTESFSDLVEDIPNFSKERRIENYDNTDPVSVDVFYPPSFSTPIISPSMLGKVKMMNAEMTRLFVQKTGIVKRKEFKHIPNEKISAFNIFKGTMKMMQKKLSRG